MMKILFFFLLGIICICPLQGQEKSLQTSNMEKSYKVKKLLPGDSIIVSLDTMYLMNRFTFQLYNNYYLDKIKLQEEVMGSLDYYDQYIRENDLSYDSLKGTLQNFSEMDYDMLVKLKTEVKTVKQELVDASRKMTDANMEINQLKEQLEKNRWKSFYQKGLWGLGGFCAGIILMAVIN